MVVQKGRSPRRAPVYNVESGQGKENSAGSGSRFQALQQDDAGPESAARFPEAEGNTVAVVQTNEAGSKKDQCEAHREKTFSEPAS